MDIYWGERVLDLVMIDIRYRESIRGLIVEEKTELDHLPVVIEVEAAEKRRDDSRESRGKVQGRGCWNESGIKKFQEEFGEGEVADSEVEDAWGK